MKVRVIPDRFATCLVCGSQYENAFDEEGNWITAGCAKDQCVASIQKMLKKMGHEEGIFE